MTHKQNKYRKSCHYSRKFIITSEFVKSFEVDSSHMPLSSQVECDQVDGGLLGVDFSLKSGHVSVLQRLAGLEATGYLVGKRYNIRYFISNVDSVQIYCGISMCALGL